MAKLAITPHLAPPELADHLALMVSIAGLAAANPLFGPIDC